MIVKTEAVVVKSMRYRETSKIVTFYTEKFGKIKGIAKGARAPKSKFGAALEPMTHVSLVIYKREGRELHTVSDCDIIRYFPRLRSDLDKLSAGFAVLDFLDAAMHDEERNEKVYHLLVDTLGAIETATKNVESLLYWYRLQFLDFMGFKPNFQTCIRCKKLLFGNVSDSDTLPFEVRRGGFLCLECSRRFPKGQLISVKTAKILQDLSRRHLSEVTTFEVSDVSKREVEGLLKWYARFHLAGTEKSRADRVLPKMAVGSRKGVRT